VSDTRKIYKGSVGTRIRLRVFENDDTEDMDGGSNFKIYYQKPDGSTPGEWTAVLDATTNKHLYYDTTADDLDVAGDWLLQSYHEKSGWKGRGETVEMPVEENFE